MLISNFYHLSYCTNIHPGENWDITFKNLKQYVPIIKNKVAKNEEFGIGLRLSNKASEELGLKANLIAFKNWLLENQMYVFTIN